MVDWLTGWLDFGWTWEILTLVSILLGSLEGGGGGGCEFPFWDDEWREGGARLVSAVGDFSS